MPDRTITDTSHIREYVFGCGRDAVFTLEFARTGARFTYRVRRENSRFLFADALTGPENESDYSFIGTISASRTSQGRHWDFRWSSKSRLDARMGAVEALDWFCERINYRWPLDPKKISFYHSGRCSRCGRFLTTPESLRRGMGPKCAEKAQGNF